MMETSVLRELCAKLMKQDWQAWQVEHRITSLNIYNENCYTARAQNEKVLQQANETYQKQHEAANAIIAQTPDPTKMLNTELKILLLPLKFKSDGLMTTRKKETIESYTR